MAKKVLTTIKLQANAGQATPAPPVGPALGQHGINIMEFCKAFNAQTQSETGTVIPVVITVYEDRSFTFVTKTPPAAVLIRRRCASARARASPTARRSARSPRSSCARSPSASSRPQRPRHRPGREDHRGHRALDGRRGGVDEPTTASATPRLLREGRPRARVRARRGGRARQAASPARSSTSRSRCTCAPV